jgi:hypothetical protein
MLHFDTHGCPPLTILHLQDLLVPHFGENIRILNVSRTSITGAGLASFLQRVPDLHCLSISGLEGVDDSTVDLIRDRFPDLGSLEMNDCLGIRSTEKLRRNYFIWPTSFKISIHLM